MIRFSYVEVIGDLVKAHFSRVVTENMTGGGSRKTMR